MLTLIFPQVVLFGFTAASINHTFLLQICLFLLLRLIPDKSVDGVASAVVPHLPTVGV